MSELNEYFRYKCFKGLKQRGLAGKQEYIDRLNYEMKVIINMDFVGYFLIVHDFMIYAKSFCVTSPGRGSAAGSLVCYCLYITELDPLIHGTYFERFLNPSRAGNPIITTSELPFEDYCKNFLNKEG